MKDIRGKELRVGDYAIVMYHHERLLSMGTIVKVLKMPKNPLKKRVRAAILGTGTVLWFPSKYLFKKEIEDLI